MEFKTLNLEEANKILTSAKPTTCSTDPCPSHLIKSCTEVAPVALMDLVNHSFKSGIYPDSLKEARVRPLLKKPNLDPAEPASYRPVANLPFLGKLLERAVETQLRDFLDSSGSLDPSQSGFRPGHGTESVLVAIADDIRRQLDRGGSAVLVLLDLTAAFDTVDHDMLLQRLAATGIQGKALSWLESFLRGRSQRVEWKGQTSKRCELVCGVPQGAILSPTLFNIYVQPLAGIARSFGLGCYQYADDTQLLLKLEPGVSSVPENFSQGLIAVTTWLRTHRLKINPSKTEILWPGRPVPHIPLPPFEGESLIPVPSVKSLGVILDEELSMEAQIAATSKSAFFHLRQARQLASYLPPEALKIVVHATVVTRLDYCNALYVGLPKSKTRKLQLVQNAAARLITRTSARSHITPVLKELHWLPVDSRAVFKTVALTFKALRGAGPVYLRERLMDLNSLRPSRTTHRDYITIPGVREARLEKTRRRAFSVVAPVLWNALPPRQRALLDPPQFLSNLKTWLFQRAFDNC